MNLPLSHPAVWHGDEIFSRLDSEFELSAAHVEELRAAVESVRTLPPEEVVRKRFPLSSLAGELAAIQHSLEHGSGAVRVRGLPVHEFSLDELEKLFFGIGLHLGTPMTQSPAGHRLLQVEDQGYADTDPRSRGPHTNKRLRFHSDRCDVIGFFCVRQALRGGENELISSMTLYNEIGRRRPDLLKTLQQPYPYLRHTVDTGNERPYCMLPVFSFCKGHFAASLLRVLIDRADQSDNAPSLSSIQGEALDFLEQVAEQPGFKVSFRQQPGDMLFLNNWVLLHRRSEFEDPGTNTDKRLLLRIWLSVPNSRPLVLAFADHFGAVAAGALRGGMRPDVGCKENKP